MKNLIELVQNLQLAQQQAEVVLDDALDHGTAAERMIAREAFQAIKAARIETQRLIPLQ